MPRNSYQAIDPHVLLNAVGGDLLSFCELSRTFLRTAPLTLERLEQAVRTGDGSGITLESHSLKSTTALVGAAQLTRMIEELEGRCKRGAREDAITLLAALEDEFGTVTQEVKDSILAFQDGTDMHTLS